MSLIHPDDLNDSTVSGEDHGASMSLIIDGSEPGEGPRLHRHAYDETWVIQEGNISFQVGDNCSKAGSGDIAIIPPGTPHKFNSTPHKFNNDGPGRSRIVRPHASPTSFPTARERKPGARAESASTRSLAGDLLARRREFPLKERRSIALPRCSCGDKGRSSATALLLCHEGPDAVCEFPVLSSRGPLIGPGR
ncbi:MAG: cupin domain-containing protein [Solirubrobacterales bacterium]|nr:cupin domain-containing protein [Solirubrobacterales bacterium]